LQTDTSVMKVNTSLIVPNKYQPRKVFDDNSINSLAESIKTYGIINPILVRQKDDKYEIIAGERRFRAAQKVGLTEVPVIIKNADEQQMAELALIENIQRQGLSPIEEAKSYEEILRIGNYTQQNLAIRLGRSQSAIANKIRLLSLPQEVQDAVAEKKISERHARSLISIEDKEKQLELLNRIITEKLTVKETDKIINEKEISEAEIKQAISDIMKSLNIKEEEKEDDNMNNGNFFPNFDNNNNNVANNNASLNMMNMQSMNQAPVAPEPEMVMPTMNTVMEQQPQMINPEPTMMTSPMPEQFGPVPQVTPELNMNNTFDPMAGFTMPQENMSQPVAPTMEPPMINDAPLFGPEFMQSPAPIEPQPQMIAPEPTQISTPMVDEPLFNPNVTMPTVEPVMPPSMPEVTQVAPQMTVPETPIMETNSFEVPVATQPELPLPVTTDKLTELQNLLNANGYTYKVYSNDTHNCVIIELPRN